MSGARFIAVVGPSGVGKDSLIEALCAQRADLHRVRRVITRAAELGGEDFEPVTPAQFRAMAEAGAFSLQWGAHGLHYGIPRAVEARVAGGQDCIANLSRSALNEAARLFPALVILSVTASPQVLAHRLAGRGRETEAEIVRRLARQTEALPARLPVATICNDGTLEAAVAQALAVLYPVRV